MKPVFATMIAFCAAALANLAAPIPAGAKSLCLPSVSAIATPLRDAPSNEPKAHSKAASLCRSPARSGGELPTCTSGPFITCRGSCSNGAEWFSWQCCIGQDGFPPACSLNCIREFAGCIQQ